MRWGLILLVTACTAENLGYRPPEDLSAVAASDLATQNPDLLSPDDQQDLAGVDLAGVDLARENHEGDLREVSDLAKADLALPDLQLADLQHPDLQLPDLQLPDLQLPDLQLADLQLPDLQPADLLQQPDMLCANEPEEPNNSCPGTNLGTLDEGLQFHYPGKIIINGDNDFFTVPLHEAPHIDCISNPFASQSFCAEVKLTPATPGQTVSNQTGCGSLSQAPSSSANDLIFKWSGTCLVNDDRTLVLEVSGAAICGAYDLNVLFYPVNTVCP